jgi:hypothetical protein
MSKECIAQDANIACGDLESQRFKTAARCTISPLAALGVRFTGLVMYF